MSLENGAEAMGTHSADEEGESAICEANGKPTNGEFVGTEVTHATKSEVDRDCPTWPTVCHVEKNGSGPIKSQSGTAGYDRSRHFFFRLKPQGEN